MTTVTVVQDFGTMTTGNPVTSAAYSLTNAPSSGNLVVVLGGGDSSVTTTISDNFGDSGGTAWAVVVGPQTTFGVWQKYLWYRQIGTGASGKQVTTSNSANGPMAITVGCFDAGGTIFSVDGTPVSASGTSTTPNGGNITTSAASSLIISVVDGDGGAHTAGSGYTKQATSGWYTRLSIEDEITTSSGTYATDWTCGSQNWWVIAAAFKAVAAAVDVIPLFQSIGLSPIASYGLKV